MSLNSVSVDIMNLLAANALGTVGDDLFAIAWGEGVDAQTLILDQPGFDTTLKENHEQPVFQVLVRGGKNTDMNTAYTAIRDVHEFLIIQPEQILGGVEYLHYEPISTILTLGRDDKDRAIFSMNYYTFRQSIEG